MSDKQVDFNGNVVEDKVKFEDVVDIKSIMNSLVMAENKYKIKKFCNEQFYLDNVLLEYKSIYYL